MVIKMESDPVEEAEPEAIIPMEIVSSSGQSATNSTGTTGRLRRKAARRSEPLFIRRSPRRLGKAAAEDVPARKKPRLEEPSPASPDEAAGELSSNDLSVVLSPPAAVDDDDDANTDAVPVTDTKPNAVATGSWTLEEDAKLSSAVANTRKKSWGKEFRIDWVTIAALFPGRTINQSKHKWYDVLDPSIDRANGRKGDSWTADEDSKLKDAVQTHGGKNWAAITALVAGRTKK
jgi:hypothetical protein